MKSTKNEAQRKITNENEKENTKKDKRRTDSGQ